MDQSLQERLHLVLEQQRAAFERERLPSLAQRRDRLRRLLAMTRQHGEALAAAMAQDFGHRARQESLLADIFTVESGARHAIRHLPRWMAVKRAPTALHFLPGRNRLMPQPLGVVGIVSPWNYPYNLAMNPALAALAAGNRVMIKPSELTPLTSALMARIVAEHFAPDEMTVLVGDAELGRAFSALPFDHLFFTGSTAVGRLVAQAAAQHLTPVTLELGGKSPVVVDRSADLALTAERLAFGKLLNAGQTCVAPDYVLAPRELVRPLAQALQAAMRRLYPRIAGNPDYTAIATPRHHARLRGLLDDARARGATLLSAHDEPPPADRRLLPTLLLDVNEQMAVMREEIFGPLLPILPYEQPAEAIAYINRHDRPLALYWFGRDATARDYLLRETHAGGVTVNDCIWHLGQEEQPFGGIGASGMGSYHGVWGFNRFSHLKPVFHQPRLAGTKLFHPPYGRTFERLLGLLKKIA
ncbi:coniferyl aldehyde dehydrogenase [Roseateles sp. DAIF2]|uniref:coniferyl aldehyde dehydrogenase n=1 Tax=Roseateles sp. DAIF2 TaxID=2714952 RepID=UPI0018A267E9|nr:coniferyl aldehyde dehydrogenase [Roseateles sp. DAIF2]QPF75294.1 coniferyl aldehyde dehydrogenase [Roseateles sp. DAIF2]